MIRGYIRRLEQEDQRVNQVILSAQTLRVIGPRTGDQGLRSRWRPRPAATGGSLTESPSLFGGRLLIFLNMAYKNV